MPQQDEIDGPAIARPRQVVRHCNHPDVLLSAGDDCDREAVQIRKRHYIFCNSFVGRL